VGTRLSGEGAREKKRLKKARSSTPRKDHWVSSAGERELQSLKKKDLQGGRNLNDLKKDGGRSVERSFRVKRYCSHPKSKDGILKERGGTGGPLSGRSWEDKGKQKESDMQRSPEKQKGSNETFIEAHRSREMTAMQLAYGD